MKNDQKSILGVAFTAFAVLTIISACAPSKKGSAKRPVVAPGNKTLVAPVPGSTGATGSTGAPAPSGTPARTLPPGNKVATQAVEQTSTADCRINAPADDAKLSEELRAQSYCQGIVVKTDDVGNIAFDQQHTLKNFAAHSFGYESVSFDKATRKVQAEYISEKRSKSKDAAKTKPQSFTDLLYVAHELPYGTSSTIDFSTLVIKVQLDGETEKVISNDQVEQIISENPAAHLIIRFKDATLFKNINFKLKVEYSVTTDFVAY